MNLDGAIWACVGAYFHSFHLVYIEIICYDQTTNISFNDKIISSELENKNRYETFMRNFMLLNYFVRYHKGRNR